MSPASAISPRRQVDAADPYLEAVRKVLPVEVTGAFIAINSLVPQRESQNYLVVFIIVVLSLVCAFYSYRQQQIDSLGQIMGMSFIAFPAWAAAVASSRCSYLSDNTFIMPSILIVVSLLVPLMSNWKPGVTQ